MNTCKHCGKECKNPNSTRNHERLCPKNTDRIYVSHTLGHPAWNKGLSAKTDERVAKNAESLRHTTKQMGRCTDPVMETARRAKLSAAAKSQGFGGYRERAGRSKKFNVCDSFGNQVCLQSSYELRCSKILNELGIRWIRPGHLKYDGKKYFPDFLLVDYNIYLDPKNSYKARLDKEKIEHVSQQNHVRVVVLEEQQLTKEFIQVLVGPDGCGPRLISE